MLIADNVAAVCQDDDCERPPFGRLTSASCSPWPTSFAMTDELITMRAADTSVDVDGVIGLEMTVDARAATAEIASSTAAA
eukprot:4797930-Prymnesium_polylepis.1